MDLLHGDHSGCGGCDTSHRMVFHADVCQEILFNGWLTTTALQLFGSAVAIFVGGFLYEGLKYIREVHYGNISTTHPQNDIAKNELGNRDSKTAVRNSMFSSGHTVQTILHVVQATLSYILMLVFMTYNVWLCLALVLGLGLGYFVFGWKKTSIVDGNELCH